MPECQLVHQSERRTAKDRNLAAGLQPATSAQFAGLLAARRVCQESSGDNRMRRASTRLPEQGTQTPSPAPDLIPAETKTSTENLHRDWYSKRGHFRTNIDVTGDFCTRWNERESTWRKSGSCPSRGTSQSKS